MASLQRYSSHGLTYYRIVESYRRPDGQPTVRALLHLGKAEDLLARLQGQRAALGLRSVASGAVDAAFHLAQELGCAQAVDSAIRSQGGTVRQGDGLTTGESLLAAAIARLVHPCSQRALAQWAAQTSLPTRLGVKAEALTRQHFWDQMHAVPVQAVEEAEQAVVSRVLQAEALSPGLLAYDTTNFYTHLETTNGRSVLAQRGHNQQRRHDLRQLGLALVVSEEGQIPLTHVLYEASRNDVRSFQKLLEPLRRRLKKLWRQAQHLGKALGEIAALSPHPRGGEESLRRQVARWVNRQYVRQVLQVEIREEGGE
jgi:phage gp46-like protein